jgi:hypothetical protein
VRARDALGNLSETVAYAWNSDTIAPNAQIDSGPAQGAHVSSAAASFAFSANEPGDFQCKLDGSAFEGCAASKDYTGLGEGSHTFQVKFTDAGGRSVTDTRGWTVDTVAPDVEIDPAIGPGPLTSSTAATFAFTASGGEAPQCKLDDGAFAPCASPKGYTGLAQGAHKFTVRSIDEADNVGEAEREWTVDSVAPGTTVVEGPPAATTATSASVFFISEDDPSASFQCSLDGDVFAACSSPRQLTGLGIGDHSLRVRALDAAGNVDSTPAVHRWRVESPPQAGPPPATTPDGASGVAPAKAKCKKAKKGKKRGKRCKVKRK